MIKELLLLLIKPLLLLLLLLLPPSSPRLCGLNTSFFLVESGAERPARVTVEPSSTPESLRDVEILVWECRCPIYISLNAVLG
jgi:hypothetical protein